MYRVASDPYEKAMKRHGFTDHFRQKVLEDRTIARAERLRLQEISRARSAMCEHSVPKWVRELVMAVAAEHGVSPNDVYSKSRRRAVIAARHAAVYLTKQTKPHLSQTILGKWFCRDHTTIGHSLAVYAQLHGLPSFTEYNLEGQRTQAINWYRAHYQHHPRPLDQRQGSPE